MMSNEYGKELLDAPCVFCGYNRENYWQTETHDRKCPWFHVGREESRQKLLRATINGLYRWAND